MQPTYCGDIHVFSSWSSDKEVYADATFHHFARKLLEARMVCLKQFLLGFNTMQIILVSEEQPAWTPSR